MVISNYYVVMLLFHSEYHIMSFAFEFDAVNIPTDATVSNLAYIQ